MRKLKKEIISLEGKKNELITVHDKKGRILHKIIRPLMLEFHLKDLLQVILGASILAIPVGYTEETWRLGETLPLKNILGFLFLSIIFISSFSYYNYYREHMKEHYGEFFKRVTMTYLFSFIIVATLLSLIERGFWTVHWTLAIKRTIIITFPASLSATIADVIK